MIPDDSGSPIALGFYRISFEAGAVACCSAGGGAVACCATGGGTTIMPSLTFRLDAAPEALQ
jgi:hypothetical protein